MTCIWNDFDWFLISKSGSLGEDRLDVLYAGLYSTFTITSAIYAEHATQQTAWRSAIVICWQIHNG